MDPVARVWNVLDVSVGEQPLDFWVVIGAGSGVKTWRGTMLGNTGWCEGKGGGRKMKRKQKKVK